MSKKYQARIDYADEDKSRWNDEYDRASDEQSTWPYSDDIEDLGEKMRWMKTWFPITAGASFLFGVLYRVAGFS